MAEKKPVATNVYNDLIKALKASLSGGLQTAQRSLEYQRLQTYWDVGKKIVDMVDKSDGILQTGPRLYSSLSSDIYDQYGFDIKSDTIKQTVCFSKNYPKFPRNSTLTFSHYLNLLKIKDPVVRCRLEVRAMKNNMKVAELKAEVFRIQKKLLVKGNNDIETIAVQRGEPFIYRVQTVRDLAGKKEFVIDCGFKISVPVSASNHKTKVNFFKSKTRVVRIEKRYGIYNIISDDERGSKIYTYCAKVLNVVDGDTIDVKIDVGFGIWLDERLRLKGIDAPEVATNAGKLSSHFLKEYLSKCPDIIIRTSKEGMYGRWLADIFALKKCNDPYKIASEGECLNQVLIDEGLASLYNPSRII